MRLVSRKFEVLVCTGVAQSLAVHRVRQHGPRRSRLLLNGPSAAGARRGAAALPRADSAGSSCRAPSTRRWPATRAWPGAWPRWCRATPTTRTRFFARRRRAGRGRGAAPRRLRAPVARCIARASRARSRSPSAAQRRSPTCSSPPPTACRSSSAATCAQHLPVGAFLQRVAGVHARPTSTATASTTSPARTASTCSATTSTRPASPRRRARRRARPGARRLPPLRGGQRAAPARDLGPRRGVVPHVGHRGGDAGGAPGALPHAAHAPGALLRRLPRLVGRRAARPRQPAAAARDLHAAEMDERTLRVLRTRRDIACVLVNPLQALHPNASAPGDARWSTAAAAPASTAPPTPPGCASCARSAASAASC